MFEKRKHELWDSWWERFQNGTYLLLTITPIDLNWAIGRYLYKITKKLKRPSSFRFYNVIVILMCRDSQKVGSFSRDFAEYLKKGSTDFCQTYVIFKVVI